MSPGPSLPLGAAPGGSGWPECNCPSASVLSLSVLTSQLTVLSATADHRLDPRPSEDGLGHILVGLVCPVLPGSARTCRPNSASRSNMAEVLLLLRVTRQRFTRC